VSDQPDEPTTTEPHDALAEQLVLAAMLDSPRVVQQVTELVQPTDFYLPAHQAICAAIYRLDGDGQPIDIASVAKALRGQLRLIGGQLYLFDLTAKMPAPASAPYHAKTVARLAVQRRLIAAGTRLVHLGRSTDDGDLQDVIAAAEAEVEAVASGVTAESGAVRVGDILDDYLDRLEEPEENPGIEWPYADVNRLLRPMRPGRLYVVGALSGVGKSIACWNVAAHAALRHKQRVLFHALEMSTDELMDRLIAAEARVSVGSVSAHTLGKGDWDRIAKAREHLDDAPLFVDESEYVPLSSLRASIRRVKPDLVIVDQLPIMTPPDTRAPREQQMAALAYGLKRLAKAENVPIIAAAQLNRDQVRRGADRLPTQHDLRESAAIGQAADVVVLLHDPCHIEKESPRAGEIDWVVDKQRGGPKDVITLVNQPHYARHADMAS
jgi:replicative DNA helicase